MEEQREFVVRLLYLRFRSRTGNAKKLVVVVRSDARDPGDLLIGRAGHDATSSAFAIFEYPEYRHR